MRSLGVDRNRNGKPFSWFDRGWLWSLQFRIGWHPYGGGGVVGTDVASMTLDKAMFWDRSIAATRRAEADAIQARLDEVRQSRRR